MTTNTLPAESARQAGHGTRWVPRSWPALGVLLLTAAAVALPLATLGVLAVFGGLLEPWLGCFDECAPTADVALTTAAALALAGTPFAAVRLYQSEQVAPRRTILATIVAVDVALLAAALSWLAR
jgi:hypothetical protein